MTSQPRPAPSGVRGKAAGVYRTPGLWYSFNVTPTSPRRWYEGSLVGFLVWYYALAVTSIVRQAREAPTTPGK